MRVAQHYIDGAWVPVRGRVGTTLNPATGEPAAEFVEGTVEEAQAAIAAATRAFHATDWRHDARLRSEILLSAASRLEERREQVAHMLVAQNGKLLREALGEVGAAISELRYYAGLARNLFGRVVEIEPGCFSTLNREAAGVAVIIVPWNAPVTLLVRSLAPALAAGCTVVVKPAHQTALVSNLVLDTVLCDPRVPAGVVNTITESGSEVARALCESAEVGVISFTGSTAVGKSIARATSSHLTRLSLELGGKAAGVVFADCDIAATVRGVLAGGLILSGQQCTALARVLVQDSLYERFVAELSEAMRRVRPGPGMDPASGMGPLIDMANRERIRALVEGSSASPAPRLSASPSRGPPPATSRACRWSWAARPRGWFSPTAMSRPPFAACSPAGSFCQASNVRPWPACWCRIRSTSASRPSCPQPCAACGQGRAWILPPAWGR